MKLHMCVSICSFFHALSKKKKIDGGFYFFEAKQKAIKAKTEKQTANSCKTFVTRKFLKFQAVVIQLSQMTVSIVESYFLSTCYFC